MDSPSSPYWDAPSRRRLPCYYSAAPNVVSIPVQFMVSDSERIRADSAVKIQKVLRGFLARKGVEKVMALRKEVDEIEKRISDGEVVELMRRPGSKERVRMIEALMDLLLRLDSVRGFDSGVRVCRKATIKKAIALQEAIDAIANREDSEGEIEMDWEVEREGEEDDALKRVMMENERLMGLMEELVEKNDKQAQLVSYLLQRMEVLEIAFVSDKLMENKKKRQQTC